MADACDVTKRHRLVNPRNKIRSLPNIDLQPRNVQCSIYHVPIVSVDVVHHHGLAAIAPSFFLNYFHFAAFLFQGEQILSIDRHVNLLGVQLFVLSHIDVTSVYGDALHFDAEPELEFGIFADSRHLDAPFVVVNLTVDTGHLTDGDGPFGHAQTCPKKWFNNLESLE